MTVALVGALSTFWLDAAAPANYYASCENKGGQSLLTTLASVVGSHTNVGYDGLWNVYKTSDVHPDGSLWDMYSTKVWTSNYTKCGNYKNVGDCVNREHSMPKSWFNNKSPMNSDAFHVYPTDGKVNGQRGNEPYGECSGGTYLAANGNVKPLGRLGTSTFPGYTGKVFEPDDEYKGDFARTYFYMAAAYNSQIANWSSAMMAGNSYPVYKSWAVELLLKWHRQDPVSEKELNRNDAVYAHQKNRNPFIDHPEMVEYIWGDKKDQKWTAAAGTMPAILLPVDGSTVDLGNVHDGTPVTTSVYVKTNNATGAVTVDASGATVSPASIQAATANNGVDVSVTLTPAAGAGNIPVTVRSGSLTSTVNITYYGVDGIPLAAPSHVTAYSATLGWQYVGFANAGDTYTLTYGESPADMPDRVAVDARAGEYTVENLASETTYYYQITGSGLASEVGSFTTGAPVPSVDFLFDGDELYFVSEPGSPSAEAELLVEIEYIDSPVTISVDEPFELSVNKVDWSTSVTIDPEEDRIYLRVNSMTEGLFGSELTVRADSYFADDVNISARISGSPTFIEDFEPMGENMGSYDGITYRGSVCTWYMNDCGIWPSDAAYSGNQAPRGGKNGRAEITMLADKEHGLGTLRLYGRQWTEKEGPAELDVEISHDGGLTFAKAGSIKINSVGYEPYSVELNAALAGRIRLRQTSGKRFLIDDLSISDCQTGMTGEFVSDHTWDAYSLNGNIVIETTTLATGAVNAEVYTLDGRVVFSGAVKSAVSIPAVKGALYIVVVNDFSRRVLVR